MVGEKLRRSLAFHLCFQLFEELRHRTRVVTGVVKNLRAHDVSLGFRGARVAKKHAARGERAELGHQCAPDSIPENAAGNPQNALRSLRLGSLIGSVAQGHVREFVRHHGRQLRFVVGRLDHPAVYEHVSARQSERVDGFVIYTVEFERILHPARGELCDKLEPELCKVRVHFRIVAERQVPLRVQGGPLPELDILLRREHVPAGLQRGTLRHCSRNTWETKNSQQGSAPNENVECLSRANGFPALGITLHRQAEK